MNKRLSLFISFFTILCIYLNHLSANEGLNALNQQFREAYTQAKQKALINAGPIIIAQGGILVLHYKGNRSEIKYIPDSYHHLKQIDHIPLLLKLTLDTSVSVEEDLKRVQKQIDLLDTDSNGILHACSSFIDTLVQNGAAAEQNDLFFKSLAPSLMENAAEASYQQLDALHTQVQLWKKQIPREEWNRLSVIVVGPKMPRVGEVTMQYFSRLTGTPPEKTALQYPWLPSEDEINESKKLRRLIYGEGLKTEQEALDLLATYIVDENIGSAFFDDQARMTCDLLAEGASKRLADKCEKLHR